MTCPDPNRPASTARISPAPHRMREGARIAWWFAWAGAILSLAALVAPFDQAIAAWAARAPRALIATAQIVTNFGKSDHMFALSAASAAAAFTLARSQPDPGRRARLRRWGTGSLCFFSSIAASGLLAQGIKHCVGRVRPAASLLSTGPFTFHPFSLSDTFASFPSGHTTSAFAAAMVLGLFDRRVRTAVFGAAFAIGASRVLVGAHYPSEVVVGAGLGSATSLLLVRWCRRRFGSFCPPGSPVDVGPTADGLWLHVDPSASRQPVIHAPREE